MDIKPNSVTFFSTSELKYTNFKAGRNKSKEYEVQYFVYKSHNW